MDQPLYYDFRDILIAPARALAAKRIFVMTLFLCLAVAIYDVFVYLAAVLDGVSLETFWRWHGLLPLAGLNFSGGLAQAACGLGIVLALLALMTGLFAVSAIEIEQLRGNRFFPMCEAIRFARRRLGQLAAGEAAMVAFLLFILLLFLLLGLVVRIPAVGEWVYAATFLLPVFFIAIFTVFIVAVLQISVILLPAAAAAERHGESFTAILGTFSTVIRQPVRWLAYTAYGLAAAKAASWIYAYFCYRAVQFTAWAASLTAGEKADRLVREGLGHLPVRSGPVEAAVALVPGFDWRFSISQWAERGDSAAGYVMAAMLLVILASVFGYALAVVATTQARAYAVIRFLKDDYRIAEEPPLFLPEAREDETGSGGAGAPAG